jgi:hypothetical protein
LNPENKTLSELIDDLCQELENYDLALHNDSAYQVRQEIRLKMREIKQKIREAKNSNINTNTSH